MEAGMNKPEKSYEFTKWGIKSKGTKKEKISLLKRAIRLVFGKKQVN